MANPLYQELNGNAQSSPNPAGNLDTFVNQLNQFASAIRSKGNPQQMVQSLLNSGKMSQTQFNQLLPMARQIAQKMGLK